MIDQSTIDKIFDASQIIEVVGDFVSLKRRGVNYLGVCPFHNEKTPSFTVSPVKNIFKCFGCGKGGNPVNFVMEHENLSYYEALKYLAKKYHIEVVEKEVSAQELALQNERESLILVSEFAKQFFSETLHKNTEGQAIGYAYFKERGIRDDMIAKFDLGYAPEKRDAFTDAAKKAGYKLDYMVKTGLTIEKEGRHFDRFAGRVIFPIYSLTGKAIAFGGRVLKTDKNTAKYLNSPESDIYHKSKVLYGIFQAKKAISQLDKCYLVEGYTDVISMHQAGIENVVASSGTSLTEDQIRLIKRFTNNLTILYDGDAAGIKAALRGIDMVLEQGLNVKVLLFPDGDDPDSYARKHSASETLEFIAKNETDFVLFKTRLLITDAKGDPVKRAALISDIVRSIAIVPDGIIRSEYVRECSALMGTNEQVLYSEINKLRRNKFEEKYNVQLPSSTDSESNVAPQIPVQQSYEGEFYEREIIRILLHYPNNIIYKGEIEGKTNEQYIVTVAQFIVSEIETDELEILHPTYKQIYDEFKHLIKLSPEIDEKRFINHPDNEIARLTADLISKVYPLSKLWIEKSDTLVETEENKLPDLVRDVMLNYKNKKILMASKNTQLQLLTLQQNPDFEKIEELQQQLMQINGIKKMLAINLGGRVIQ